MLEKNKVIERIKKAKSYGLKYSKLANEVGFSPASIYNFVNGNSSMSQDKQIKVLCYIEKYVTEIEKQLEMINYKELCTKWTV